MSGRSWKTWQSPGQALPGERHRIEIDNYL